MTTIRAEALRGMLKLEIAASNWFAKMSERERKTYVKAHPRSKYARNTGSVLAQQADKLASHHQALSERHRQKADYHGEGPRAQRHDGMADHHAAASGAYLDAVSKFTDGDHAGGQRALQEGHQHAARAEALKAQKKPTTRSSSKTSKTTGPKSRAKSAHTTKPIATAPDIEDHHDAMRATMRRLQRDSKAKGLSPHNANRLARLEKTYEKSQPTTSNAVLTGSRAGATKKSRGTKDRTAVSAPSTEDLETIRLKRRVTRNLMMQRARGKQRAANDRARAALRRSPSH